MLQVVVSASSFFGALRRPFGPIKSCSCYVGWPWSLLTNASEYVWCPTIDNFLYILVHTWVHGSWTKKLIDRVYNTRKRQASENASDETPPAKRGRPKLQCVLARYPPIEHADDSNDEVANSRNLDALRKEMERDKPRKEFVLS